MNFNVETFVSIVLELVNRSGVGRGGEEKGKKEHCRQKLCPTAVLGRKHELDRKDV